MFVIGAVIGAALGMVFYRHWAELLFLGLCKHLISDIINTSRS